MRSLGELSLLLQLFLQLLYQVVLVIVQQAEVLDVHVCLLELFLEISDLAFLIVKDHELWIDVLRRRIGDLRGSTRVVQRAQILLEVLIRGREASNLAYSINTVRETSRMFLEKRLLQRYLPSVCMNFHPDFASKGT